MDVIIIICIYVSWWYTYVLIVSYNDYHEYKVCKYVREHNNEDIMHIGHV